MFWTRLITIAVLAPLMVWAMYDLPEPYFSFLIAAILLVAAFEFAKMTNTNVYLSVFFVAALMWGSVYLSQYQQIQLLVVSALWWLVNLYWVLSFPNLQTFWYGTATRRLLNICLLLLPTFMALTLIRQWLGAGWLLFLVFLIWGADIGAYLAGRRFGKNKLAPNVSPGKTVEGVLGGMLVAVLVSLLALYFNHVALQQWLAYVLLTLVVVGVSIVGDLYESIFKRASNSKDSSQLLPGHGGVLDRIDSITSAAPFFLLGCLLINKLL